MQDISTLVPGLVSTNTGSTKSPKLISEIKLINLIHQYPGNMIPETLIYAVSSLTTPVAVSLAIQVKAPSLLLSIAYSTSNDDIGEASKTIALEGSGPSLKLQLSKNNIIRRIIFDPYLTQEEIT
jgi:hypothetical protein